MALIKCPKCGADFSSFAEKCPKCASPFEKLNKIKAGLIRLGIALGISFIVFGFVELFLGMTAKDPMDFNIEIGFIAIVIGLSILFKFLWTMKKIK